MNLNHDKETDSLDIELSAKPVADSAEAAPGVVLDDAEQGTLAGIDIDHAGKKLSLDRLESNNFPVAQVTLP